ncbi:hypothetical protein C8046_12520 [Serinibacter arcticus]|uniref:ROK family protein n=1 Tax=Serinibacter arcticus TaxID=1655435 RepID=A0A2U1ZWP4_9MICO|nr:ROK family protein [Serinibacter arcticus]PWD51363.1 hypothetical protein C8046_12520 [Serinibacter arcticus]
MRRRRAPRPRREPHARARRRHHRLPPGRCPGAGRSHGRIRRGGDRPGLGTRAAARGAGAPTPRPPAGRRRPQRRERADLDRLRDAAARAARSDADRPRPPQERYRPRRRGRDRGRLLTGATGRAFEPGHIRVDGGALPCGCGRTGCLATVASPASIVAAAGLEPGDDLVEASARVHARARAGDPAAAAAVEAAGRGLRDAVTTIATLLAPQLVVLAGDLRELLPWARDLAPPLLSRLGTGAGGDDDGVLTTSAGPTEVALGLARVGAAEARGRLVGG